MSEHEQLNFTWGLTQEILNQLGYVQVTGFMLDGYAELGLTRDEFLCILHLARFHYNSPKGQARPSAASIAEKMGYGHANSVRLLTKSLEKKKMLTVTRQSGKPSVYDASPFALATFRLWQRRVLLRDPHNPLLGSDKDTLTTHCDTPSQPIVTEENKEEKELGQEKNYSASADFLPPEDDYNFLTPMGRGEYVPGPGKLVSCVDPDTDEEVGEPSWRFPQGQVQNQAFEATGRSADKRFRSKAEYNKLTRIERMLNNGELPVEFWENRIWCAQNHRWSFPKLLEYTLSEDSLREWEAKQQ